MLFPVLGKVMHCTCQCYFLQIILVFRNAFSINTLLKRTSINQVSITNCIKFPNRLDCTGRELRFCEI